MDANRENRSGRNGQIRVRNPGDAEAIPDYAWNQEAFMAVIHPEEAKALVDGHENYRILRDGRVSSVGRGLQEGLWEVNGETIKFDESGTLVDGQHRLEACIATGIPIVTWVILNVRDYLRVDTGMARTLGDALRSEGFTHVNTMASVARMAWKYDREAFFVNELSPDRKEILDYVKKNPTVQDSAHAGCRLGSIGRPAVIAFIHHMGNLTSGSIESADNFVDAMVTDRPSDQNHPAQLLARRYIQEKKALKKISTTDLYALGIVAWNLHAKGKRTGRIALPRNYFSGSHTRSWARFPRFFEVNPDRVPQSPRTATTPGQAATNLFRGSMGRTEEATGS